MLGKVIEIVKEECKKNKRYTNNVWESHISVVLKYAKFLAKELKADTEVCQLAALLHDFGSLKFGEENHEITGQAEAQKILSNLDYSQKLIDQVKECINSHRGSKDIKPKTLEAKIVANADAMAHFNSIPALLRIGLNKYDKNERLATNWVLEKLEKDWTKKLTIPEAKTMVQEKYYAAKLLFK